MPAGSTLIRATQVFQANGERPLLDAVVRVDTGIIDAVGRTEDFGVAAQAATILEGTILPGFVDSHAHPTLPADGRPLPRQAEASPEVSVLTAVEQLQRHLRAGYTAVRDCGAKGGIAFALRHAINGGITGCPSLSVVGRPITPRRGHLHWCGAEADTPAEIEDQISNLASEGADAIKIVASGGSTGGVPTQACYDAKQLAAALTAAHDHGLSVVAHCRSADAIALCAEAGIDVIAHLEFLQPGPIQDFGGGAPTAIPQYDPRIGDAIAASGAFLDLNPHSSGWDTLLRLRAAIEPLSDHEQALLRGLESYFDGMLDVIRQLASLGLADRMSFGSDAGAFDTEFGHPEYNSVIARLCGLSPAESIQVITRNAANSIGLGDEIGTIEIGKRADLVLVAGDPLSDPSVLSTPRAVMRDGSYVITEWDFDEQPAHVVGIGREPTPRP